MAIRDINEEGATIAPGADLERVLERIVTRLDIIEAQSDSHDLLVQVPPPPVLTGHVSSLPPYWLDTSRPSPRTDWTRLVPSSCRSGASTFTDWQVSRGRQEPRGLSAARAGTCAVMRMTLAASGKSIRQMSRSVLERAQTSDHVRARACRGARGGGQGGRGPRPPTTPQHARRGCAVESLARSKVARERGARDAACPISTG